MPRKTSAAARPAKTVGESAVEMVEVVLPNDANPLGNILGGRVMHLIDMAGAIAAHRHSRRLVVTASMDQLHFLSPIKIGHLIILKARVNHVAHSSMEVGVEVHSENILTGERRQTSTAYITFVAIDENGHPAEVPRLKLDTAAQRRRNREALARRRSRLQQRGKLQKKS